MAHHETGNLYGSKPVLPPLPRAVAPRATRRGHETQADAIARATAARARLSRLMRAASSPEEFD